MKTFISTAALIAILLFGSSCFAAGGSASPAELAQKLCAAEQSKNPEAMLAVIHPEMLEMLKNMMSSMGEDPWNTIVGQMLEILESEPVKTCEIITAGEKPCPEDVSESLMAMMETPVEACGEIDLKLALETAAGTEEATEHDNLIRTGGEWFVGDTEVGRRTYKIVLPMETPEQKAASIKELETFGASLCAALKKGEPLEIFEFLHPATIEFLKGFVIAFAEEGQADPWADFVDEQRTGFKNNPISACNVTSAERTECDMTMLQEMRGMLNIRADRCGGVTFGQTIRMGDEEFSNITTFSENGRWYLAK